MIPFVPIAIFISCSLYLVIPRAHAFLWSSQSSVSVFSPPFGCIILCSYVWIPVVLSFSLFPPV
ncbi:hypothetical protein PILCRDRAFT_372268 [Piloderma croceum F 1598]|uniref:Uncharacterized protein n=1 Tax=Piloderma croceum (strain F 1598) TaxID=765440 RepID=A0A0C3G2K9_PILCF|nr:hypothetical protein PILCRDRAFT_372268 [Piloderma croceum F 1598]